MGSTSSHHCICLKWSSQCSSTCFYLICSCRHQRSIGARSVKYVNNRVVWNTRTHAHTRSVSLPPSPSSLRCCRNAAIKKNLSAGGSILNCHQHRVSYLPFTARHAEQRDPFTKPDISPVTRGDMHSVLLSPRRRRRPLRGRLMFALLSSVSLVQSTFLRLYVEVG